MKPITRRQFLIGVGGSALATALASCAPPLDSETTTPGGVRLPTPASNELTPPPTEILRTSAEGLYQQNYSSAPNVNLDDWSLTIDGLVDSPLKIDLAAIKALPQYNDVRTLECIGNPVGGNLIGNIEWNGVHIKDVFSKLKIDPKATHVNFQAADGYYTNVELDWIMQDGTMLAYGLNGAPLAAAHGFPLRINMPGLYGQKMPKWITHIEFTDQPVLGFWEAQGWSDTADVQTNSQISFPRNGQRVPVGAVPVYGIAYAGKHKITKVEISPDDQNWLEAKLLQADSSLVWTQWSVDWPAAQAGVYHIQVRATDETGFVQSANAEGYLSQAYPKGTNAIDSVAVRVE
jgi:DMSO/TMAO reductase YedYZ molybdopterin-dependent catalytic subunit